MYTEKKISAKNVVKEQGTILKDATILRKFDGSFKSFRNGGKQPNEKAPIE